MTDIPLLLFFICYTIVVIKITWDEQEIDVSSKEGKMLKCLMIIPIFVGIGCFLGWLVTR